MGERYARYLLGRTYSPAQRRQEIALTGGRTRKIMLYGLTFRQEAPRAIQAMRRRRWGRMTTGRSPFVHGRI